MESSWAKEAGGMGGHGEEQEGLVPGLSFFPLSPSREASAMLHLALPVCEGSLGD